MRYKSCRIPNLDDSLSSSRLEYFDVCEWDKQLNVGLKGAFLCSKVFGNSMAMDLMGVIS